MIVTDFIEKLKNKEITIQANNHCTNDIEEYIMHNYSRYVDFIEKLKSEKDVNLVLINSNTIENNTLLKFGIVFQVEIYCFNCGISGRLYLHDNILYLIDYDDFIKYCEINNINYWDDEFLLPDELLNKSCIATELINSGKMVSEIEVNDTLIFANHFGRNIDDSPSNERYSQKYSVNSLLGRFNCMQYLANNNFGYGQMGNMSIDVYVNDNKTEILIGGGYFEENDNEQYVIYEGFKKIGQISCDVWRWMCSDYSNLKKNNFDVSKISKEDTNSDSYEDYISINVKHGTWKIEHYYDIKEEGHIYSKLILK